MSAQLAQAAQAVIDRWDSPQWEWTSQGPTADLIADLRKELAAFEAAPQQEPVAYRLKDEEASAHYGEPTYVFFCSSELKNRTEILAALEPLYSAPQQAQAPDVPRPFGAVKSFADSVLSMLDERIKTTTQAAHPFNDKFGDHPETLAAANAQASELKEVRHQVRSLGDRALVELMKFKRTQEAQQAQAPGWQLVPVEPTAGLLMSMALRFDHGLGCPGYYDQFPRFPGDSHQRRLEGVLTQMRQIYEEVSGAGFYRPDLEESYKAMAAPQQGSKT